VTVKFQPEALPVLIGSLPVDDHGQAMDLVLSHTPDIPLWVQLPMYREEGMMEQFLPGMPGLTLDDDRWFLDTSTERFDSDLVSFYEDYMAVESGDLSLDDSRFVLTPETARGFFVLMDRVRQMARPPVALKGQITGPVTFGVGVKDQNDQAIFYNDQLRDAAIKLLAMKARWQVEQLSAFGCPVIVFFDEPALAGFGSSAFISISRDDVARSFQEVIAAVHAAGGLAGIHVCANADWSLILDSDVDIVSFDAFSYFDKFLLYPDQVKQFIESGRILAWGIVPTLEAADIDAATVDSLGALWKRQAAGLADLGIDPGRIQAQTLITPACGTGSLSLEHAKRVLCLTQEVSAGIRGR